MWKHQLITFITITALTARTTKAQPSFGNVNNAGVARWMAQEASWGTLTTGNDPFDASQDSGLFAGISPFASSSEDGRLFFFLMDELHLHGSALTLSQAAMNPGLFPVAGCGSMESAVDAQDPRCAKITYKGSIHPCSATDSVGEDCDNVGREALFEKYPEMAQFPSDHGFHVHEFRVSSIWMIANFGGGGDVTAEEYHQASPEIHTIEGGSTVDAIDVTDEEVPAWDDYAARSRWIVHHSLFTAVSTRTDDATTFGNIRSITDGETLATSTGQPNFYLPDVDPTAVDIQKENKIILSFSEAALAQLVTDDGKTCSGQMAGMPTCAQLSLYGKAVPNDNEDVLKHFGSHHPLAPWLAAGGSHMEGNYYTIDIEKIVLLDYFGGPKEVSIQDYLDYKFPDSGEAPNHEEYIHNNNQGSYGMGSGSHEHGHGEGDQYHGHGEGEGHGEGMSGHEGHGEQYHGHGEGMSGHEEHGHEEYGGEHEHGHGEGMSGHGYSSQSNENTLPAQANHAPYFLIILAAFFGSYFGSFTRDKCTRRRRYLPAQKDDNSLHLSVDTAEAC